DHPLHFAFLGYSHEERDIDGIQLMAGLPHGAGHANPLHGLLQCPRVFPPLGGDRLLGIAALDNELCAAFELLKSGGELIAARRGASSSSATAPSPVKTVPKRNGRTGTSMAVESRISL